MFQSFTKCLVLTYSICKKRSKKKNTYVSSNARSEYCLLMIYVLYLHK